MKIRPAPNPGRSGSAHALIPCPRRAPAALGLRPQPAAAALGGRQLLSLATAGRRLPRARDAYPQLATAPAAGHRPRHTARPPRSTWGDPPPRARSGQSPRLRSACLLLLATLRHAGAGAGCAAHATGARRAPAPGHAAPHRRWCGLRRPRHRGWPRRPHARWAGRARATWRPQLAAAALGGRQRLALASRDCRAPDPHATGEGEIILLVLSF
ncbi:hypothetical protein PVAP13_5KG364207 [Panicum virgatum]|uniref:Uncharacterized protein n=1 Tax=Panicum virgatum TaxID=38727 RepID=A0A8T0SQA8_PANVG|nr:hypothetical protein PVAP13_5KG364207 [Panicum virgatum]